MKEQAIISEIDNLGEDIRQQENAFQNGLKPLREKLSSLRAEYSRLFSPLKPGDEIPYTPPGGKHAGIVRIISANCKLIPDKWEYDAEILSVGEGASDYDKKYIGQTTFVDIHRSQTPQKLN